MQIFKVSQNHYYANNSLTTNNKINQNKAVNASNNNFSTINFVFKADLVSFNGLNRLTKIPLTKIEHRTLHDRNYLNALAKAVNLPVENLKAIMGLDEFKTILKKAESKYFNPKSDSYMINTHTHTTFSDGKATVEEILNEAQARGEKSGRNFLISITDHDTLESAREAIKLIAGNPEKYKNIRFVVGAEPSFKYENSKILKKPIIFDALMYGINPFDKRTRELFEKPANLNKQFAKDIIAAVNQKYNIDASFEKACEFNSVLKTGGSRGFFRYTKDYLEKELKDQSKIFDSDDLIKIFKPYYLNQDGSATKATTNIKTARNILKEIGYGEIEIAHPAIVDINPQVDNKMGYHTRDNLQDRVEYNEALEIFMKTTGLKMAEGHYQYPESYYKDYSEFKGIISLVNKIIKRLKMIASGGTDSHNNNKGKILESR